VDAYAAGYYVGALAFFAVLGLIFWFVGRWGWVGVIIRAVCAGLAALKILSMLAHPGP
jgi:hypothetical protein